MTEQPQTPSKTEVSDPEEVVDELDADPETAVHLTDPDAEAIVSEDEGLADDEDEDEDEDDRLDDLRNGGQATPA